jgi:6,7-dimethyl-8-ribityllumazine synthase
VTKTYQGDLSGRGLSLAIVVSRFNSLVTDRLLSGASDALERHGVDMAKVEIAWVPGSLEIPLVARRFAASGRCDAVICLGAVIRGETPHFGYVAGEAARGISWVSRDTGVPTIFGVITANTLAQALDRAGGKAGNKGYDAALTAIEMANLLKSTFSARNGPAQAGGRRAASGGGKGARQ